MIQKVIKSSSSRATAAESKFLLLIVDNITIQKKKKIGILSKTSLLNWAFFKIVRIMRATNKNSIGVYDKLLK